MDAYYGGAVVRTSLMRSLMREGQMKGGITLFRGVGAAARRYLESDRATADDYYLEAGTALANFTITNAAGEIIDARALGADEYAAWVDWIDPATGLSRGTPREAGGGKRGSPRFAEMVINAPEVTLHRCRPASGSLCRARCGASGCGGGDTPLAGTELHHARRAARVRKKIVPVESLQTVACHITERRVRVILIGISISRSAPACRRQGNGVPSIPGHSSSNRARSVRSAPPSSPHTQNLQRYSTSTDSPSTL